MNNLKKKKPDFLIIGTAKGGTDALYTFITEHPKVIPAKGKEIRFFNDYFDKGYTWYVNQFPSLIENNKEVLTGEATPNYLDFSSDIPRRVFEFMPDVKLIVLLRNPIDRAYSYYQHQVRLGQLRKESGITTFEELIEHDLKNPDDLPQSEALLGALYGKHLRNWMNVFPREQILILKSEDYYNNPAVIYDKVLNFLNLEPWRPRSFYPVNQAKKSRTFPNGYDEMKSATREKLKEYFKRHNQDLYELIGRNMGW